MHAESGNPLCALQPVVLVCTPQCRFPLGEVVEEVAVDEGKGLKGVVVPNERGVEIVTSHPVKANTKKAISASREKPFFIDALSFRLLVPYKSQIEGNFTCSFPGTFFQEKTFHKGSQIPFSNSCSVFMKTAIRFSNALIFSICPSFSFTCLLC